MIAGFQLNVMENAGANLFENGKNMRAKLFDPAVGGGWGGYRVTKKARASSIKPGRPASVWR